MRTDLFDFDLPAERIALRPVSPRDAARLLVVRPGAPLTPFAPAQAGGQSRKDGVRDSWVPASAGTNGGMLEDRSVRDLPDLLQPGDCLVVNDSKVIAARLKGRRIGRGEAEPSIEATLIKRIDGSTWNAFVLGAKKVQVGDTLRFGDEGKVCFLGQLDAQVSHKDEGGEVTLSFAFHGPVLDQAICERGDVPLPPYIASKRPPDEQDKADYQTVFAHDEGSVAAPTAGLHFTPDLLARLEARGVAVHKVTLHVGPGTFLPVKADDTSGHKMHSEFAILTVETAAALNAARAKGGRVVAVGSTAMRTLESAAAEDGAVQAFAAETAIFITPGYRFKACDLMLTNFHLPRSTLFMLVSAFSGLETMQAAYKHAIESGYRFYSYGDACLLYPQSRAPDAVQHEPRAT
ncbi:MAG: tRNA preQ1(34) S-adenosylmethionine ribosyltransferase-isomerase QueA [Pseudolabrys sp.]